MRWRSFGGSGLKVTELCLGTMTFGAQADEVESVAVLDAAWDAGIRCLDTADVYPVPMTPDSYGVTERILGRWLRDRGTRGEAILATKAYFPAGPHPHQRGAGRRHLVRSCEHSLQRLDTDWIDLFLLHGWDDSVPVEETLRALEDLRRAGKVLHTGICNLTSPELAEAVLTARTLTLEGFTGIQHRYNALTRDADESLLPMARRFGLGVMVYNPLAGGLLSGRYAPGTDPAAGRFTLGETGATYRRRYWEERNLEAVRVLRETADTCGMSLVTASIAWVLSRPAVSTAIIGVSRLEQLRANLEAPDVSLPAELAAAFDRVWFDLPRRAPTLDTPRLTDYLHDR